MSEKRLFDSQWVNIVNHANCYRGYDKAEAVALAVKLTELAMAENCTHTQAVGDAKATDDALRISVFNLDGYELFICAVHGQVSIGILQEMESELCEYASDILKHGDGVYEFRVREVREDDYSPRLGWEFDLISHAAIANERGEG